jgi:hypothetical protein
MASKPFTDNDHRTADIVQSTEVMTWTTMTVPEGTTSTVQDDSTSMHVFEVLVVAIGTVGTLANGFMLYVMCTVKQLKKHTINVLFVNQMSLDLYSCVWLVIVYAMKLSDVQSRLTGSTAYYVCLFVTSETIIWYGLVGSSVNLAAIAVDRYVKIVHPIWHKNRFRPWMVNAAIAFAWFNGVVANQILGSTSTVVVDGECWFGVNYVSRAAKSAYGIWYFVSYFVVVLSLFVYCYGRIVAVVRHRTRVFASNPIAGGNPQAGAAEMRAVRSQTNAVKTAIVVSALYVVCWLPCDTYSLVMYTVDVDPSFVTVAYYVTVFVAFFYVCLNPFIYVANYELVQNRCLELFPCFARKSGNEHISTVATVCSLQPNVQHSAVQADNSS